MQSASLEHATPSSSLSSQKPHRRVGMNLPLSADLCLHGFPCFFVYYKKSFFNTYNAFFNIYNIDLGHVTSKGTVSISLRKPASKKAAGASCEWQILCRYRSLSLRRTTSAMSAAVLCDKRQKGSHPLLKRDRTMGFSSKHYASLSVSAKVGLSFDLNAE